MFSERMDRFASLAILCAVACLCAVANMWHALDEGHREQRLEVGKSAVLDFTSGIGNERGRQELKVRLDPGRFKLTLANHGSRYSDQWIIWDYLALQGASGKPVWGIGVDHVGRTPPDYSERAFSEFAEKNAPGVTSHFVVGQTKAEHFCREVNDDDRTSATIEFVVSDEQAQDELTLLLSTLYSTHSGASEFRIKVDLRRLDSGSHPP